MVLIIAEKDENAKTGNCLKANFDIRDRFRGDTKVYAAILKILVFEKIPKNLFFDLKLLIKKIGGPKSKIGFQHLFLFIMN